MLQCNVGSFIVKLYKLHFRQNLLARGYRNLKLKPLQT